MFGALTSDEAYLMYKPEDSEEHKAVNQFIERVSVEDRDKLFKQLNKSS
jgi:hypothetical protein